MNTQNIFVYGLLQSNYDNEAAKMLRKHAALIGPARIPGTIFDFGNYPAAIFEKNMKGIVSGELYYIHGDSKQLLKFLMNSKESALMRNIHLNTREVLYSRSAKIKRKSAICYLYNRLSPTYSMATD